MIRQLLLTPALLFFLTASVVHAREDLRLEVGDGHVIVHADPEPDRPWLGVLLDTDDGRVRVEAVAPDSPAAAAGLEVGDVILEAGGEVVTEDTELGELVADGFRPGDSLPLVVERDGETVDLSPELAAHPGTVHFPLGSDTQEWLFSGDAVDFAWHDSIDALKKFPYVPCLTGDPEDCPAYAFFHAMRPRPRLGVTVEAMSEQLAGYFGVEPGVGLLVTEVYEDTAAERAGVQAGDVLLRIEDRDIEGVDDVREVLAEAEVGSSVDVAVLRRGDRLTCNVEVEEPEADEASNFYFPWVGRAGTSPFHFEMEKQRREHAEREMESARRNRERAEQALERAERALERAEEQLERAEERRLEQQRRREERLRKQEERRRERLEDSKKKKGGSGASPSPGRFRNPGRMIPGRSVPL